MIYGELGRYLWRVLIDQHMLNYQAQLVNAKDKELKKILYQITCSLCHKGELVSNWIQHIKQLLNFCEGYNHWLDQTIRCFLCSHLLRIKWKEQSYAIMKNSGKIMYTIFLLLQLQNSWKKLNPRKWSHKITNTFKNQFGALQSCQS